MNERYIQVLSKLLNKSYVKSEIPVACIIINNNKIIAKAYNKRQKCHDVTKHAEIIAIRKAERRLKDWRLNNCTMYVTLKPCKMCEEVIRESRLDKCIYLLDRQSTKSKYEKTDVYYQQTTFENDIKKIIQKAFKKLR